MAPRSVARNKRARFEYEIFETFEAGLVLTGTEVKSLREGRTDINDAFVRIRQDEAALFNMHIPPYDKGNIHNVDPLRARKLLLHRREIKRLAGQIQAKGLTLVALKVYFKRGWAKVLLGLGRGKREFDKRQTIKRRESQREISRAMSGRRRR